MTLVFPASTAELPDVRRCQPCHVVLLEQQQVNKSGLLLFGKLHPANPAFEGLELLAATSGDTIVRLHSMCGIPR